MGRTSPIKLEEDIEASLALTVFVSYLRYLAPFGNAGSSKVNGVEN